MFNLNLYDMKVLRRYTMKNGVMIQESVLVSEKEEDLTPPHHFATIKVGIDPFNDKCLSRDFIAHFPADTPFLVRIKEIEQFINVLKSMFNA